MKQTLTAKLKLKTTPEQFKLLRSTQLAYRDALNFVSQYAFEHQKMSNNARLRKRLQKNYGGNLFRKSFPQKSPAPH